jgi:rSAM/selenodomain-associated transferase 1
MVDRITACVLAKPPLPGRAKTRLAAAIGPAAASALAEAFLRDTWSLLCGIPWIRPVLVLEELVEVAGLVADEVWLQGDGDLGQRLERTLRRALRESCMAFALGSDSPGLPVGLLRQARGALLTADTVLGPASDGGFYLLGMRACPLGAFAGISWSSATTCEETREQLRARGLRVALIGQWFDVDHHEDLARLAAALARGAIHAPATRGQLHELGLLPDRT